MDLDAVLEERGLRYGSFSNHAEISERINCLFEALAACKFTHSGVLPPPSDSTKAVVREALRMISNKLGRAFNGDITYADTWDDIAGYAKLVANHMKANYPENQ